MGAMTSQITSLTVVYSTVYSGADQRIHQSSASLAFVRGIHRWPVNSPHKWPVMRKMFPFDDVIMNHTITLVSVSHPRMIWVNESRDSLGTYDLTTTKRSKIKPPHSRVHWGQHGAHLGPTGLRWAPCWPHELCYLRCFMWHCTKCHEFKMTDCAFAYDKHR